MFLEQTETDFIKSKASELINDPKIGRVTQVYEHLATGDNSNFEMDVRFDGGAFEERATLNASNWSAQVAPPKVGDKVVVDYLAGESAKPVVVDIAYPNKDRPPLGRAGMFRDRYESDTSPAGDGNLYLTGYTKYDGNPARKEKSTLSPEETWIQIAKHTPSPDIAPDGDTSMQIEMYDSPTNAKDAAHIRASGSQVDGDATKGLALELDFKSGEAILTAENGTGTFGVRFDANGGGFTIIDQNGYGITSDGAGNFTWHYSSLNYSKGTTTSL